jgi:hypothetical protein
MVRNALSLGSSVVQMRVWVVCMKMRPESNTFSSSWFLIVGSDSHSDLSLYYYYILLSLSVTTPQLQPP